MTLSPFDFIMLAVVAFKGTVALLFLRWLDTSPKKTEATDTDERLRQEAL